MTASQVMNEYQQTDRQKNKNDFHFLFPMAVYNRYTIGLQQIPITNNVNETTGITMLSKHCEARLKYR
jgi:hypothetical protein